MNTYEYDETDRLVKILLPVSHDADNLKRLAGGGINFAVHYISSKVYRMGLRILRTTTVVLSRLYRESTTAHPRAPSILPFHY